MSDRDVDLIATFYDAVERDDFERIAQTLDEDLVWEVPDPLAQVAPPLPGPRGFERSRTALCGRFAAGCEFLQKMHFASDEDHVVVGRLSGHYKGNDWMISVPFVHVWTVRGGNIVRSALYPDTDLLLPETARRHGAPEAGWRSLEIVVSVYEATNARDQERVLSLLDPAVDWRLPKGLPYGGRFIGHQGVLETRSLAQAHFVSGPTFSREQTFHSGGDIVVVGAMHGRTVQNALELNVPFVHVWRVRRGKVVARRQYTDTGAIVAAL